MSEDTSSGAAFIEAVNLEPTDGGPEFTQPESSESVVDTAYLVKVDIVDLRVAEPVKILDSPFGPVPLDQANISHLKDGGFGQGDSVVPEAGYTPSLLSDPASTGVPLPFLEEVPPEKFREAVLTASEFSDIHARNLNIRADYGDYSCWLSHDGLSGMAISEYGEITNVFTMEKGRGQTMMEQFLSNVASAYERITLNCFDGILPEFYGLFGFKEVERQQNTDDADGPDVVYMEWNREL